MYWSGERPKQRSHTLCSYSRAVSMGRRDRGSRGRSPGVKLSQDTAVGHWSWFPQGDDLVHRNQSQLEVAEALHKSLAMTGLSREEDCEMVHLPTQLLNLPQQSSNAAVGSQSIYWRSWPPTQATDTLFFPSRVFCLRSLSSLLTGIGTRRNDS